MKEVAEIANNTQAKMPTTTPEEQRTERTEESSGTDRESPLFADYEKPLLEDDRRGGVKPVRSRNGSLSPTRSISLGADYKTPLGGGDRRGSSGAKPVRSRNGSVSPMRSISPKRPAMQRTTSMRSMSPKRPAIQSAHNIPDNNRSNNSLWSNESMTSFRVSRRSLVVDSHQANSISQLMNLSCSSSNDLHGSATTFNTLGSEDRNLRSHVEEESIYSSEKEETIIRNPTDEMPSPQPPPPPTPVLTPNELKIARFRTTCGHVVNAAPVQLFMSFLIVANAAVLGTVTFESVRANEKALSILEGVDLGILIAFTLEIALHLCYLGIFNLIKDSWLLFDLIVVLLSWCFIGSSLAILRSFRIFRIFSLVSRWESLRTLFEAVGSTIPKMASIWLSLLIVFYIFCVLFTTLYAGLYEDNYLDVDYFGSLDKTFVTLFQIMTLDNWSEVARQTMEYQPWSFLGFFIFIVFSSFFVINLVVAVICESLIQTNRNPPPPPSDALDASSREMLQTLLRRQEEMTTIIQQLQQDVQVLRSKEE